VGNGCVSAVDPSGMEPPTLSQKDFFHKDCRTGLFYPVGGSPESGSRGYPYPGYITPSLFEQERAKNAAVNPTLWHPSGVRFSTIKFVKLEVLDLGDYGKRKGAVYKGESEKGRSVTLISLENPNPDQRYMCHTVGFSTKDYFGRPLYILGNDIHTILEDGWHLVEDNEVRIGDTIVYTDQKTGVAQHSAKIEGVKLRDGKLDADGTRLITKNGLLLPEEPSMALRAVDDLYKFPRAVYRRKGPIAQLAP